MYAPVVARSSFWKIGGQMTDRAGTEIIIASALDVIVDAGRRSHDLPDSIYQPGTGSDAVGAFESA